MDLPHRGPLATLRPLWLGLALAVLLGLAAGEPGVAAPARDVSLPTSADEAYACAPRLQLRHPQRCGENGPGAAVADLARRGMYPVMPLPSEILDETLGDVPFNYIRLPDDMPTRLYGSPEDARQEADSTSSIEPGFDFLSWDQCDFIDGKSVYMIDPGVYMPGGDSCSRIKMPTFHGLAFSRTPTRPFGWIVATAETYRKPGVAQAKTGDTLYRFTVVQIYDAQTVDNRVWYEVGPDEWIEQTSIAKVDPDPTVPEGVQDNRWISINLFEQTLAVYDRGELVFATMTATGLPGWWTQPGVFQVYKKLATDTMSGSFAADRSDYYYLQDVPWVMYFDKARALHGAYWHNGYGYPRSHGCVNLSPFDAHWLYNWADEGTYVYVWDPTGKTPTDAELYGSGGA
jgi:lipoprotein-anchoring transpeptidase ErfK/SrfK